MISPISFSRFPVIVSALLLFITFFFFPSLASAQWYEVPGNGRTLSAPSAVVDAGGALHLFIQGLDDKIYTNRKQSGTWSGWSEVPGGGRTREAPLAVKFFNDVYLFVIGIDNAIYYNRRLSATVWEGWKPTGNGGIGSGGLQG
jgi:hypothetical protein